MTLITGTSDIATNLQGWYDRILLKRPLPAPLHGRYGQIRPLPSNKGTRINFRRFNSLAVNTTALTEGVTPTGKKASTTDIYATVKFYGDFLTASDVILLTGLDATLVEFGELLGEQMRLTADTLDRDVIIAGTSVRYANSVAARTSIVTAVSTSDLKSAIRILTGNNAKKLTRQVIAGEKVGTRPIPAAFRCIAHTDCQQDLEALAGFTKVEEYASSKQVSEEEIGTWGQVRFELTTNAKVWLAGGAAVGATGLVAADSTTIDVYAHLILAENAYATVPLQKGNVKNIIKSMGSAGTEDPLNQRATSGWKMARTAKILNDNLMIRGEFGVTDL